MSNSVGPDQGKRPVGPDLDPDCLHIISLNISVEMLDAPQEIIVVLTALINIC